MDRRSVATHREEKAERTHHASPSNILEILLASATDALRLVQAEEAVVDLARDRVGRHEVVEEPLLAKPSDVSVEDGEGVLWE